LRRVEQIQTRPLQGALLVRSVGAAQPLSVGSQTNVTSGCQSPPLRSHQPAEKHKRPEGPKFFSGSSDTASFNALGCIDQTGTELVVVRKASR